MDVDNEVNAAKRSLKGAVGRIAKIQDKPKNVNIDNFSVPPLFLLKPKTVS